MKSIGLSDETVNARATSSNILNLLLNYVGSQVRLEFKGGSLKQDNIIFTNAKIVNINIVYKINKNFDISCYPTQGNCLFGAVKLTKHIAIDQ